MDGVDAQALLDRRGGNVRWKPRPGRAAEDAGPRMGRSAARARYLVLVAVEGRGGEDVGIARLEDDRPEPDVGDVGDQQLGPFARLSPPRPVEWFGVTSKWNVRV